MPSKGTSPARHVEAGIAPPTAQYPDAKRREAIIPVLRREDLDDCDIPRDTGNFP